MASVLMPRLLRVGAGACRALPEALRDIGCSRPLICTDKFMASSGHLEPLLESLEAASMKAVTFDGVVPDPVRDNFTTFFTTLAL